MIELLNDWDTQFFLFLNGLNAGWLDYPMALISSNLFWLPLYLFIVFLMIRHSGKQFWLALVTVLLVVTLSDGFTSRLMKPIFQRKRPSHEENLSSQIHLIRDKNGHLYKGGLYGFASSHAANTFGTAMFLWLLFRRKWKISILLFFWAALVSYSRIYLGVHYPLDILGGALVGMIFAMLLYLPYARFKTHLAKP